MSRCPCSTGKSYLDCCGAFISGQKLPSTPEELMRSRYTAYHQAEIDYIAKTMQSPAADNFNAEETKRWANDVTWVGLEVINSNSNLLQGFVEFIAHYFLNNKKYTIHEISEFKRVDGVWFYVDGAQPNSSSLINTQQKIGRNNLCPCGSGKKYKKCCGNP